MRWGLSTPQLERVQLNKHSANTWGVAGELGNHDRTGTLQHLQSLLGDLSRGNYHFAMM